MFSGYDQEYRSVELAYSQGLFQEAQAKAEALLGQGESEITGPQRQRLQLLLGHIHFHGLRQPELAAPLYRSVLETAEDPTTRDLAAQGLTFCKQSVDEQTAEAPASVAAMPWLEESPATVVPAPAPQAVSAVEEPAAPVEVLALEAPPVAPRVEEVRVRVLEDEPAPPPPDVHFSAPEEAELAKGLMRVVLR